MKAGIIVVFTLMTASLLQAQCPDEKVLWNRIIFLRDTSDVTPAKQLDELLSYQKKIEQCSFRNDSTHALLLQRIGWLYNTQKDFANAIQYTQQSLTLIKQGEKNPGINPAMAVKSYYNLALLYDHLNLETKKIVAVDSCIFLANHLNTWNTPALSAIGLKLEWLFGIGDYFRCIKYATTAESIACMVTTTPMEAEQVIFDFSYSLWKINSLTFVNKTDEALRIVTEKIRLAENAREINLLAAYYGLYASLLRKKENPQEAIRYFKKSFQYNLQLGWNPGCAEALNNIGFIYSGILHQNKIAIHYHFDALKYADKNESLNILGNIANIYAHAGNYDSAFIFFQKAFDQLRPGFTEPDLLKKSNDEFVTGKFLEYITGMMLDKAEALLTKYKSGGNHQALKDALLIYQLTDRYFDKLKSAQSEIQSKLFWKTNNRRLYEQAVEACYASKDIEKALYFFEKSRSVLLNDQIMEQRRMDDRTLAKQAQLNKTTLEIESKLANTSPGSKEYLSLLQQLITIQQELESLLKNVNTQRSAYAYNYSDTISLSIQLIKDKILDTGRQLLEIFSGDSAVYILSVTQKNSSFTRLDKHLYDSLVTGYISFIADREKLNKDFVRFASISYQLYELIFTGIQSVTEGSLVISPDGKSFPFEALVVNANVRQPDYLLNHYATSYTYSAKYLANEYLPAKKSRNNLLGMAPVKYSNGLAALAGSDLSLQKIQRNFPDATNFVFEKATKDNFLRNFSDYSIIQLYTHAADSSSKNDPVIYFYDSAFYLSELIADRKPVTQLVVLSACETANGKLYEGEGIFSFNRGFAALGIPAAVSTLWSVDNESTYRITELFYKYLLQGLPTDVALQKAKLEFINTGSSKEKKLPYYWAAPILTGKVDVIKSKPLISWEGGAIAGVILLLGAGYFTTKIISKRRKKEKS